jgi:hypothetical protein
LNFRHKKSRHSATYLHVLVPKAGLEPARTSTVDFESTASTDFATSALKGMRKQADYTVKYCWCKVNNRRDKLTAEKKLS